MWMSPVFVDMGGPDVVYGTLPKPLGLWASTKVGFKSIRLLQPLWWSQKWGTSNHELMNKWHIIYILLLFSVIEYVKARLKMRMQFLFVSSNTFAVAKFEGVTNVVDNEDCTLVNLSTNLYASLSFCECHQCLLNWEVQKWQMAPCHNR